MPNGTICRVGPLEGDAESRSLYLLLDADASIVTEVFAAQDVEGLRGLVIGRPDPPACEPSLHAAASALGLAVVEPTPEQNAARADVALRLAGAELPRTEPPIRHRMFLQGMGALLQSSSWQRLGDGETALISVSGRFEDEHYDLGISLSGVVGADPPTLLAMVTDFRGDGHSAQLTIETVVRFEEGPPFLVDAMKEAYDLHLVPRFEVKDGPAGDAVLRRYGPALGAACYMLADLDPGQMRRTVRIEEDETPMQLRVSAGFGLADAEDIFGREI